MLFQRGRVCSPMSRCFDDLPTKNFRGFVSDCPFFTCTCRLKLAMLQFSIRCWKGSKACKIVTIPVIFPAIFITSCQDCRSPTIKLLFSHFGKERLATTKRPTSLVWVITKGTVPDPIPTEVLLGMSKNLIPAAR